MATLMSLALAVLCLTDGSFAFSVTKISKPNTATLSSSCAPSFQYKDFSFAQVTSFRSATSLPTPAPATTYAAGFSELSTLLPLNATTTTYSLNSNANDTGRYGQSAFAALWATLTYANTTLPFTTTVSPTPIAASELVYPPALYDGWSGVSKCSDGLCLPKDFIWGVAGSAWQSEGAGMFEGRGPCQLDTIGTIEEIGTNDTLVANMHYLLYKQDIARLAALGISYYSFSIAWTRIVPFGDAGSPINQLGLDHYEDVIETCLSYGIIPVVTLMHFDSPMGYGFTNDAFVEAYHYYAKQVMTRFADHVPIWVTFNEPNNLVTVYQQNYNVLMAHAGISRWYKEELKGTGRITIKFANNIAVPLDTTNQTHIDAALRYQDYALGVLANPIFLGQQYPESVTNTTGISLTSISDTDLAYINGTVDFFSVDPYTTQFAYPPPNGIDACAGNSSDPNWPICVLTTNVQTDGWLNGNPSGVYVYLTPQYFRQHLAYVWDTFKPTGIAITEFGFANYMDYTKTFDEQRYDLERTLYYTSFLGEVMKAINLDRINVIAAFAWSFADNNEFGSINTHFGLQTVNRSSPMLERQYKRSIFDYVDFMKSHIAS